MIRKLPWVLMLVALVVVAVVYFTASPSEPVLSPRSPSVGQPAQTKDNGFRNASAESTAATKSHPRAKTREEVQEEIRKLKEEIYAPSNQKKLVDSFMEHREPKIRELFDSWDLDAGTAEKVLQAIRQRQERYVDGQFTGRGENMASYGTVQSQFPKHDAQWTEVEFQVLLGVERAKQLARLEAQISAESAAEGISAGKALAKERERKGQ